MKIVLLVLAAFLIISIVAVMMAYKKIRNIENYKELYEGMDEKEMLKLMGGGFVKEDLPKYSKYEWSILSKNYKGTNNVIVKVKDGKVVKVESYKKPL